MLNSIIPLITFKQILQEMPRLFSHKIIDIGFSKLSIGKT